MRTIARTHKNKIAAVRAAVVEVKIHNLAGGFIGQSTTVDAALSAHQDYDDARLVDNEDGTYNVNLHANLWYKLYTAQAIADRDAAPAVEDAEVPTYEIAYTNVHGYSGTLTGRGDADTRTASLAAAQGIRDTGGTATVFEVTVSGRSEVTEAVAVPHADLVARLRALNLADRERPVWKAACGSGGRGWIVLRRTPGADTPNEVFTAFDSPFAATFSPEDAVTKAERLNAAGE
jgi:hypothetical protein